MNHAQAKRWGCTCTCPVLEQHRGVPDEIAGRRITGEYIMRYLKQRYVIDLPRDVYVRVPRCLVDFGFDEVEYTTTERFERAFGVEAAYRWGFRRRPIHAASFSRAMKDAFIGPIKHAMKANRPLWVTRG